MKVLISRHNTFTGVLQHISIAFKYASMYLHTKDATFGYRSSISVQNSVGRVFFTGPEFSLTSLAGLKERAYEAMSVSFGLGVVLEK